jgi:acetolactate synthase-1/2/3 large subunit
MKLSDYVFRLVADSGVQHVFLVPGGGAMHLNESLSRCSGVDFVCNLHEQASAIAAENYSKATNHLGVALVTTGPGSTNAITGLAGAWLDSTPCLFLSGQVKRADRMFAPDGMPLGVRQVGMQEVDIVSIVRPLTKYAITIDDPGSIRYHMEKALHLAKSGRPGPVWIDIPLDVQASPIDPETLRGFDPSECEVPSQIDMDALVGETIRALNRSERPMLLAGNGIRLARAEKEFLELVEALDIRVDVARDRSDCRRPSLICRSSRLSCTARRKLCCSEFRFPARAGRALGSRDHGLLSRAICPCRSQGDG